MLGPSGCGKTTLLRIIAGLVEADRGSLFLEGNCLDHVPAYRRNVNTVFQNYALFPHLDVYRNVAFGLKMKRMGGQAIDARVEEVLSLVELRGFERRMPQQLSGGQQQRVALARALVNRPQVLLLDEPLAALDVKLRKTMQIELRAIQQRLGMTFVYVTHDQEEALRMSDRIAVMNAGKVEQVGAPQNIYNEPKTRFVAEFIGETNFFESEEYTIDGDTACLSVAGAGRIRGRSRIDNPINGKLTLAVRPERIRINMNGDKVTGDANRLRATIDEVVYLGTMHHINARLGNGQRVKVLTQISDKTSPCAVGDDVHLEWSFDNTIALAD